MPKQIIAWCLVWLPFVMCFGGARLSAGPLFVTYEGVDGPGMGKHIVLVSGDEEYRSEEGLPQLGKILARQHGFTCTVVFAINRETGEIDPQTVDNIPGLEALDGADLMIIATRFRDLPDEQMKHIVDYIDSARPIIGMRTATHAFNIKKHKTYARLSFNSRVWDGRFGRQILGETWISHHGHHGHESTRGLIAEGMERHPIVRGIKDGDIWGPTDVYTVRLPLPGDSQPIIMGQVLEGMNKNDPPVEGRKNDPMMPVGWTKTYQSASGKTARVFTTTMGAATDLATEGTRRMLVNAVYWALGMEDEIPSDGTKVDLVGEYHPTPFGFGKQKRGMRPTDYAW